VALKVLPDRVAQDRDRLRRFRQEAQAAAAVTHPNVAHIYEIGNADSTHFIAMEHVPGQSLAARIHDQPPDIREIAAIGGQMADALDEAHGKGIIHRDVKPSNVILTPRQQVKVLDFGLARLAAPSDASTLVHTSPGTVMGTVIHVARTGAWSRARSPD
jgi:serine/threonine protein kinase